MTTTDTPVETAATAPTATTEYKPMDRALWKQVEQKLSAAWGHVDMRINGLAVNFSVRRVGDLRYVIMVFVDGKLSYKDTPAEVQELLWFTSTRMLHSAKTRAEFTKEFGKRAAKRHGLDKTFSQQRPYWGSAKALCAHLRKTGATCELGRCVARDLDLSAAIALAETAED